jgi:hypothetical protein
VKGKEEVSGEAEPFEGRSEVVEELAEDGISGCLAGVEYITCASLFCKLHAESEESGLQPLRTGERSSRGLF